jgi:uncharacterized protein YcfJ
MKTEGFNKTHHASTLATVAKIAMVAGAFVALASPVAASATEYQTVERPRQECWNEQVPVQTRSGDYGGAIVGGIAGGILGNQVGGGNGRTVATAVGAMTGAVVGDRMSGGGVNTVSYQTVQRCRTVVDHVQVPVVYQRVEVVRPVPVVERRVEVIRPVPVVEERHVYVVEDKHYYKHKHKHKHHHHDDDD